MEIPPPDFRSPECNINCCVCGAKCILYRLNDPVWNECASHADCCGGHLCVDCAERILERKLTLDDLAIEKYLLTAKNETGQSRRVIHCVVDTVIGAADHVEIPIPGNWCFMWDDYYKLGKKLCRQTPNAPEIVRRLIDETNQHFPDFTNPYSTI